MLKTDYSKVTDIFLCYPKGFDEENDSLSDFFEKLIGLIPDEIHQYIIINNKGAGEKIKDIHPAKKITPVLIEGFNEIWLRDIIGFNTEEDVIIKPEYRPDYYSNIYDKDYLKELDDQAREIIRKTINKNVIDMPLVIDGGNLVTNGEIGILTNKIFRDNDNKSEEEIKGILKEYLGIRPIIIETSKYDKLGHSDGYVSFLNDKEICLVQYPEKKFLKEDIQILKKLEAELREEGFNIIHIYDRPIAEKTKSKYNYESNFLYSAKGNYVNFIRLNQKIILPQFKLTTTKESNYYNTINREILSNRGKDIFILESSRLGDIGGGSHCISFTN